MPGLSFLLFKINKDQGDQTPSRILRKSTARVQNEDSACSMLLGKSTGQGMPCERIQYQLMEPGSAQRQHGSYVFTSCRLPDGSWKLAG